MKNQQNNCKQCGYDPSAHPAGGLYRDKKKDRKLADQYIEDHEVCYKHQGHHMIAIWKKCCGVLDHYQVKLTKNVQTYG